jgi:hypothetical protein
LPIWCSSPFFQVFVEFTINPIIQLLNYQWNISCHNPIFQYSTLLKVW